MFIDKERCKGCMLCISACPKNILDMSRKLNSRGFHYPEVSDIKSCIGCKNCAEICPDAAIEIDSEEAAPNSKGEAAARKTAGKAQKK